MEIQYKKKSGSEIEVIKINSASEVFTLPELIRRKEDMEKDIITITNTFEETRQAKLTELAQINEIINQANGFGIGQAAHSEEVPIIE